MKEFFLSLKSVLSIFITIILTLNLENIKAEVLTTNYNYNYQHDVSNLNKVTLYDCNSGTWIGTTSTSWNDPSNWCDGILPSSSTSIIISIGTYQPILNGLAECQSMTIMSGATLTLSNESTLKVNGNWNNNGTFTANSSTVIFSGAKQTITGSNTFNNLTIGGTGEKTIPTNSNINVNGVLSMEGDVQAILNSKPTYGSKATLQYNTTVPRTTGVEWPALLPAIAGVIIKNTGVITLYSNRSYEEKANSPITIMEGATLNLGRFKINYPSVVNLYCGGLTAGSTIKGIDTGSLIQPGAIVVTNAHNGIAPAIIDCKLEVYTFDITVPDASPNNLSDTDLELGSFIRGTFISKSGDGTLKIKNTSDCYDLNINAGNVTLASGAQVTVKNNTSVVPINGLTIQSDANNTASLITSTCSGNGTTSFTRTMTNGAWHLIASPLKGQKISDFLSSNFTIPSSTISGSVDRAMREYLPESNQWGEFYTNATLGELVIGKGCSIRVKTSTEHQVVFTGKLVAGDQTIINLNAGKWNCIGNPYTSAIGISALGSGTNTANFLTVNSNNIDPAYGIYIWNKADIYNGQPGQYTVISNVPNPNYPYYQLQAGQAFMVKMASLYSSVNFTKAMQLHLPVLSLKSTEDNWPIIELEASTDSLKSSTIIAFHEGMTTGLDPTYDAGLLRSDAPMELSSRLVKDYGIPFAIQALPLEDMKNSIIPVDLDYKKGGRVSFTARGINLPSSIRPIIEDRLNGIFTDISDKNYITEINPNSIGPGRFYLHISDASVNTKIHSKNTRFQVMNINNNQWRIKGSVGQNAMFSIFDEQGRIILLRPLELGSDHDIYIPSLKSGLYFLNIQDNKTTETIKVISL